MTKGIEGVALDPVEQRPESYLAYPDKEDINFLIIRQGIVNDVLAHYPNVRWLQLLNAGFEKVDLELLKRRGILFTNARSVYCATIAEDVIAKILLLARNYMRHFRDQNANVEPVFLAFRDNAVLGDIIRRTIAGEPEYDFVAEDGIGHTLWVISDEASIEAITKAFAGIDAMYIADGHHRTAASVRIGVEKREQNPHHRGDEEYNYFMAVAFPHSELKIMDYNRVVKDLNGLSAKQFIEALQKDFIVECRCDCTLDGGKCECELPCHCPSTVPYRPEKLHNFSM